MTSSKSDIREQAERRYEREQEQLHAQAERQQEVEREQGIRSHIATIQRQRDEERREHARREAAAEAEALAIELGERAADLQRDAEGLSRRIEDYAELRARLQGARRRAGRDVGGGRTESIRYVLPSWFRSLFGGYGSLVGVGSELAGRAQALTPEPRTLAQRDPLASTGSRGDVA